MSETATPSPGLPASASGAEAEPIVALAAGTRIAEFEIRRVLGSGGFGIVYLAWDHALEREVALKEYMPASLAHRGEGLAVTVRTATMADTFALGLRSFINEARLLARFDHPSLVKVYRFWEDNGTAYMVMPHYEGRTLRQVRTGMVVPPGEAASRRVLDALLSALEVLHREGVYHRDIAPDNILLGNDGLPVLLDFGAARRVIGDSNKALTSIMKPHYAPLEQYADQSAMRQGPWTDLYALGGTIYFLITGREPVPAASRALHDDLPRLTDLRPAGCTHGFLAAVDWMLALKPAQRPQSVHMLRDVLEGRITMPAYQAGDRTMPGVAARGGGVDIPTGPGDLSPADAGTGARTIIMPSAPAPAPAPLSPTQWPAAPASIVATPAARPFTRRQQLVLLAVLLLLNVLAWWWFARGGLSRSIPAAAEPTAAAASRPAAAVDRSEVGKTPSAPPITDVGPSETVLSVLPARAARPASSPAALATSAEPTAATAAVPPPRGADSPAFAARSATDTAPGRAGTAATAATTSAATAADAVAGPRARCGDRNFLTMLVCMKRECEDPALRSHPECVKMREQEEAMVRPSQR